MLLVLAVFTCTALGIPHAKFTLFSNKAKKKKNLGMHYLTLSQKAAILIYIPSYTNLPNDQVSVCKTETTASD